MEGFTLIDGIVAVIVVVSAILTATIPSISVKPSIFR